MKRFSLSAVLLLSGFINCVAQESIYVLHPAVGAVIDKDEKVHFLLFPETPDSTFQSCYINQSGDNFFLNTTTVGDVRFTRPIDPTEIERHCGNITKLIEFYAYEASKDSINEAKKLNIDLKATNVNSANFEMIDNDTRSKIADETRSNSRLKRDAERLERSKNSADFGNDGVRVEWFRKKKK